MISIKHSIYSKHPRAEQLTSNMDSFLDQRSHQPDGTEKKVTIIVCMVLAIENLAHMQLFSLYLQHRYNVFFGVPIKIYQNYCNIQTCLCKIKKKKLLT
jgi:hypothetical protein